MRTRLAAAVVLLLASAGVSAGPVQAQSNVEGRVGKLESEMRAVQRKVFPGGAGQYLQPEVEAPTLRESVAGAPAASAVADLTSRVSSLESQMSSLTGQVEQAGYRARQVQDAFDAYRRATDARLKALETAAPVAVGSTSVDRATDEPAAETRSATKPPARATAAAKPPAGVAKPIAKADAAPTRPAADDGDRAERLAAIAKPDTGDAIEDAYTYGYRLWQAKLYPEAQAQFKKVAAAGPTAKRYSFAQNLLGRAYLDDGKPSLATMAFYDNYKKAPDGPRAPESLYYLASALMKLNKPADACKVYDELSDVYANKLTTSMKGDVAKGRVAAQCK